jgi:hypothetical protein
VKKILGTAEDYRRLYGGGASADVNTDAGPAAAPLAKRKPSAAPAKKKPAPTKSKRTPRKRR